MVWTKSPVRTQLPPPTLAPSRIASGTARLVVGVPLPGDLARGQPSAVRGPVDEGLVLAPGVHQHLAAAARSSRFERLA